CCALAPSGQAVAPPSSDMNARLFIRLPRRPRTSRVGGTSRGIRGTGVTEHPLEDALLWLNVGRPDHLAPLLSIVGDKLTEVAGRARKDAAAEVSETGLHLRVVESRVDHLVPTISVGVFLGAPMPFHPLAS